MTRKALRICVEVEVQAVTCPGVWLCPNGKVQLVLSMLGQEGQTKQLPPVFPLLFHEKFLFRKTYSSAGCLAEVQAALGREDVYAVLVQEAEDSVQLARFHCSALHLLYPSPCAKGLLAGVDVDLLMEASADYPGILSPKIELSTKTTVEEVNFRPEAVHPGSGHIINPKTLCSQKADITTYQSPACQVKEIFSDGKCYRQPSGHYRSVRQSQDDLAPRVVHPNPHLRPTSCAHRSLNTQTYKFPPSHFKPSHLCNTINQLDKSIILNGSGLKELCQCGAGHLPSKCPLCARYKETFSSMTEIPGSVSHFAPDATDESASLGFEKIKLRQKLGGTHQRYDDAMRSSRELHAHVDRVLEPDSRNMFCDGVRCKENLFHNNTSSSAHSYPPSASHIFYDHYIPGSLSIHSRKSASYSDFQSDLSVSQPTCHSNPHTQRSCGNGDEVGSHRHLFYANLEKFYRKLYMRAKYRAQQESGNA